MSEKTMYILNLVIKYLPIILLFAGILAYFFTKYYEFKIKRQEIVFTKIEENKILEIKAFYKSYHALFLSLKAYAHRTEFGHHDDEIFSKMKEQIREDMIDFEYKSMTAKLFINASDIKTIEEINEAFERIRIGVSLWHLRINSKNFDKYDDELTIIINEIIPKEVPALIKKIEESLRKSFQLK